MSPRSPDPDISPTARLIGDSSRAKMLGALADGRPLLAGELVSDPTKQTLPVGIALFPGQYTMPWGEIAAASIVASLPLIALVLPLQPRIVHGLVAGAVKG